MLLTSFQGIWKIISGMLDPVVRSKISFTSKADDFDLIPHERLPQHLGGTLAEPYKWIPPKKEHETTVPANHSNRIKLWNKYMEYASEFESVTKKWIASKGQSIEDSNRREYMQLFMRKLYLELTSLITGSTYYTRAGFIQPNGAVVWRFKQTDGRTLENVTNQVYTLENMERVYPELKSAMDISPADVSNEDPGNVVANLLNGTPRERLNKQGNVASDVAQPKSGQLSSRQSAPGNTGASSEADTGVGAAGAGVGAAGAGVAAAASQKTPAASQGIPAARQNVPAATQSVPTTSNVTQGAPQYSSQATTWPVSSSSDWEPEWAPRGAAGGGSAWDSSAPWAKPNNNAVPQGGLGYLSGNAAQGSGAQGSGAQGSGARGYGAQGSGAQGYGAQGYGAQGSGAQGSGVQRSGAQGSGVQGSGAQGSGVKGSGVQGSGAQGSGAQGSGAQGSGAQGYSAQGYSAQGDATQNNATPKGAQWNDGAQTTGASSASRPVVDNDVSRMRNGGRSVYTTNSAAQSTEDFFHDTVDHDPSDTAQETEGASAAQGTEAAGAGQGAENAAEPDEPNAISAFDAEHIDRTPHATHNKDALGIPGTSEVQDEGDSPLAGFPNLSGQQGAAPVAKANEQIKSDAEEVAARPKKGILSRLNCCSGGGKVE